MKAWFYIAFCCFLGIQVHAQSPRYALRVIGASNVKLNGCSIGLERHFAVDKAQKFHAFSGLRFGILSGYYQASNEKALRANIDSLDDELHSRNNALNAMVNLYFGCGYQINETWSVQFSADLIGIGFGNTTQADFKPADALINAGRTDLQDARIERIDPQLLNLFIPWNRSRGSLQMDACVKYHLKNQQQLSLGAMFALRGYETGPLGIQGNRFFRQNNILPVLSYHKQFN